MPEEDLGVRVVIAFGQFPRGRILYPPGVLRQKLLANNLVEKVLPPPRDATEAAFGAPLDRQMHHRGPGRPPRITR